MDLIYEKLSLVDKDKMYELDSNEIKTVEIRQESDKEEEFEEKSQLMRLKEQKENEERIIELLSRYDKHIKLFTKMCN